LKTLFYKLCNFQHAPIVLVVTFDGDGRPTVKRGIRRVRNNPIWLTAHLKEFCTSFGYYVHTAPGEAEAELAQLNKLGFIDVVLTEDSDAIVFGAPSVMRIPAMTDAADLYTSESIESGPLSLNEDGLLLFALLVGGDYDTGISNCGPAIAHGLARTGLGRKLRQALTASDTSRPFQLAAWREALKLELRTNSSGLLPKRQPKVADTINTDFPNPVTVELYMDPLLSWCSRFTGTPPDTDLWIPQEPDVQRVYSLCITHFRWQEVILERLKSKLMFSVCNPASNLSLES
ncbi:PIN domain-like protein, partial [Mycena vitilis]